MIRIHNSETGEIIDREMTPAELEQFELEQSEIVAIQAEVEAKANARASALAKLAALGLTPDEVASL
jgi:hypothetical protein